MKAARLRYMVVSRLADFILRQLYPLRSAFLTKRRLGTITAEQVRVLRQIEGWINEWELRTIAPRCGKPIKRLAALGLLSGEGFRAVWRCGLVAWHDGECGDPTLPDDRAEERPN